MSDLYVRKNIRLKGYDYSSNGIYFITVCSKDRDMVFGEVRVGAANGRPPNMVLSETGMIVKNAIDCISDYYSFINVDNHVIMPNHLHLLLRFECGRAMRAPTVSTVINQFKGSVSKRVGHPVWQKLFYDHIIRNEKDYLDHWNSINENLAKWIDDDYYQK